MTKFQSSMLVKRKLRTEFGKNTPGETTIREIFQCFCETNKRCKSLWKNVELHSVVISIDTKMFFFLLERAWKVLQKNIFSRSNIAHLAI